MKRLWLLLFCCLITADLPGGEVIMAPVRAGYVRIDGKLDEAQWQQVRFVNSFKVMGSGQKPVYPTEVGVINTDNEIIFGFRCHIPADKIKAGKLFDECVEVMIDPQGSSESYFHFALGYNGELFDRFCDQGGYVASADYESNFRAARQKGEKFWTAEIAIPFRALELFNSSKEFWSVNCARESREISAIGQNGYLNVKGVFLKMAPPRN